MKKGKVVDVKMVPLTAGFGVEVYNKGGHFVAAGYGGNPHAAVCNAVTRLAGYTEDLVSIVTEEFGEVGQQPEVVPFL